MRIAERSELIVVAVELGFPLSHLAWQFSLRHSSPALATQLSPVSHLLPLLVVPLAILVWATLRRLRRGLPPWQWAVAVLTLQLTITVGGQRLVDTTLLTLIFACTALVTLRGPWSWLLFGTAIAVGGGTRWLPPSPAMLGFLLHNLLVGLVIYAVVHMGELAAALRRAQDQLARFVLAQERERVSRDLHDTLGQELTAIGLRAELSARLMRAQPERAAAEIRAVQQMTEQALHGVREVARGQWQPVFSDELTTGTALLESSGVRSRLRLGAVPRGCAAQVAGWALREGITNVLKHSTARSCWLTTTVHEGLFRLSIENDGVRGHEHERPPGTGLGGITDRVTRLGGQVRSGPVSGGRFRLTVEISNGDNDDMAHDQGPGGRGHAGAPRRADGIAGP